MDPLLCSKGNGEGKYKDFWSHHAKKALAAEIAANPVLQAQLRAYPAAVEAFTLLSYKIYSQPEPTLAVFTREHCLTMGHTFLLRYALAALSSLRHSSHISRYREEIQSALVRSPLELPLLAGLIRDPGLRDLITQATPCFVSHRGPSSKEEKETAWQALLAPQRAKVQHAATPAHDTIRLRRGRSMPMFGLGTGYSNCYHNSKVVCDKGAMPPVEFYINAFQKAGIRMVDTAALYGTEKDVGEGLRRSGVPRKDVFLMTKAFPRDHLERPLFRSIVGAEYIDLPNR